MKIASDEAISDIGGLIVDHRIVWVHGIGQHAAGYSDAWRQTFNEYLQQPDDSFVEVVWETVFDAPTRSRARGTRAARAAAAPQLTPREEARAKEVEQELTTFLQARQASVEAAAPRPRARAGPGEAEMLVWADPSGQAAVPRGLLTWLFNPAEYLGDFARYLVSRAVRSAVKEKFKERLRPLVDRGLRITTISHSWGTVVAYDSLLDLSGETPNLEVRNLITLGSPLWMVRRFLEDSSGRKPPNVPLWVNITARGDLVGSWLQPSFKVDEDLQLPSMGQDGPHGSYFVPGNEFVQKTIIAQRILS